MDNGMTDQFLAWIGQTVPNYPSWFAFDFSRYLIGAGSVYILVNVLLSRVLKNRKIKQKKAGFRQMAREFKSSIIATAVFSTMGFIVDIGVRTGAMTIYSDMAVYGAGYFVASLLLIIVAQDAYFYWTHRLLHLPRMMKKGHLEHHKSIIPTPWTAYSFNVLEALVHAAFLPLFLLFLPMHGLAIFLFLTHMIIRNAVGHSGYELFPRSWAVHPILGHITMVTHHDMHHSSGNSNFGLYFTWWDRMMGTEHPDYLAKATGNPAASRRSVGVRATAATIAACIGLMATAIASPVKADDADIEGLWVAGNGSTVIEVARCSEKSSRMCGTVVYNDGAEKAEVGMSVLKSFKKANVQGMKRWDSGKIASIDGGRAKKGKLVLLDNGDLKVSACGKTRRCQNETWVRPAPALAQKATAVAGGQ